MKLILVAQNGAATAVINAPAKRGGWDAVVKLMNLNASIRMGLRGLRASRDGCQVALWPKPGQAV